MPAAWLGERRIVLLICRDINGADSAQQVTSRAHNSSARNDTASPSRTDGTVRYRPIPAAWRRLFPHDDEAALRARMRRAEVSARELRAMLAQRADLTAPHTEMHTTELPDGIGAVMPVEKGSALILRVEAPSVPEEHLQSIQRYARAARSPVTLQNYESKLRTLTALVAPWGARTVPMEPGVACASISALADAGYSGPGIRNFVSALRFAHLIGGFADPTRTLPFRMVYEGVLRTRGVAPTNQKAALIREDVHAILEIAARKHTVKAAMQCAMIAMTYDGAFRRSDVNALDIEDIRFEDDGRIGVYIGESKTDQWRRGLWMWLSPYDGDPVICPVRNLRRWLRILEQQSGPLFRRLPDQHSISDARVEKNWLLEQLKALGGRAGFAPEEIGSHSLRAGWATQAVLDGVPEIEIAKRLRHGDLHTLLTYFRPGRRRYDICKKVVMGKR